MREPNTVALLGAGIMANTVAARLDGNGFELRRYNRTTTAIQGRATVCASPAQAAEEASVVWSFVHDDTASAAMWFGPDGALTTAGGALVIESSTLSPAFAAQWRREAESAGARPVLAPVTGSRPGIDSGRLVAFTAAADADLAAADPLMRIIAGEIVDIGDAATTATVKLLNNAMAAVILTGFAEAMTAAATLGLDREQLVAVWSRHGWAAPVASAYGAAMIDGGHELTNCSLAVIAKDLRYMTDALGEIPSPLMTAAAETFQRAMDLGLGDREMSAVIDATRDRL